MENKNQKVANESLYKLSVDGLCGVLMKRKLAIKAYQLIHKQKNELRQLLNDNIDDLYTHDWTLAYPDDIQTTVYFTNLSQTESDKKDRIKYGFGSPKINKLPLVINAKSMKKAEFRFLKYIGKTEFYRGE